MPAPLPLNNPWPMAVNPDPSSSACEHSRLTAKARYPGQILHTFTLAGVRQLKHLRDVRSGQLLGHGGIEEMLFGVTDLCGSSNSRLVGGSS